MGGGRSGQEFHWVKCPKRVLKSLLKQFKVRGVEQIVKSVGCSRMSTLGCREVQVLGCDAAACLACLCLCLACLEWMAGSVKWACPRCPPIVELALDRNVGLELRVCTVCRLEL